MNHSEEGAARSEGRRIRAVAVDVEKIGTYSNAIEDIYEDDLDAIVLRHAFPTETATIVTDRVRIESSLPWLRPNKIGPNTDIRVLGIPATPTFEAPRGPDVEDYFSSAQEYDAVIRGVFPADCEPAAYTERLLARVSGDRSIKAARDSRGRSFARCSLRSLPEGQSIIVHNDYFHFTLPVYGDLVSRLDTTISLSFFALIQAPEVGGELVVNGLTHQDSAPTLASGLPDTNAIQGGYVFEEFDLSSGDVIVFGAGKFYHQVRPVIGKRPRITLGGFLAFDRDRKNVIYWN